MPQFERQTSLPDLAAPARRALAGAGIASLEDLAKITRRDLERLHGMGPNAIAKLQKAMDEAGLAFALAEPRA
jgi:hypothetical protein